MFYHRMVSLTGNSMKKVSLVAVLAVLAFLLWSCGPTPDESEPLVIGASKVTRARFRDELLARIAECESIRSALKRLDRDALSKSSCLVDTDCIYIECGIVLSVAVFNKVSAERLALSERLQSEICKMNITHTCAFYLDIDDILPVCRSNQCTYRKSSLGKEKIVARINGIGT